MSIGALRVSEGSDGEEFVDAVVRLLLDAADRHGLAGWHDLARSHRSRATGLLAALGM